MATNFVQPGDDSIPLTAPAGGVVSGTPVKINRLFAIPAVTASVGETFSAHVEGVWDIPKISAEPWSEGLTVYWNTGAAKATSISTTALLIGYAVATAANPTATGRVLLTPGAGAWLNQT